MSSIAALERIKSLLGPRGWSDAPDIFHPLLVDHTGQFQGKAEFVAFPASTEDVAEVVKICAEAGIAIVPQGGNTGLCAGAVPESHGTTIILNLKRMNRIRKVDAAAYTIVVDAGCVLADVQSAAADANRLFPLSLGAEGSCQIGGNIATNAGGTQVLRFGNTRELTLGLEVVLPNGEIWNDLKELRKNNTGYDLKQLYIGSEGTLGIITAASLRLFPSMDNTIAAFVAVTSPAEAMALFELCREKTSDCLTAFELMSSYSIEIAVKHGQDNKAPFSQQYPWSILLEVTSEHAIELLESALTAAFEKDLILDAVISQSISDLNAFWRLREGVVEVQGHLGKSIKHDISVPLSRIPEFIAQAERRIRDLLPDSEPLIFGHCGDGNIHCNVAQVGTETSEFDQRAPEVTAAVYEVTAGLDGSISAEHGIGLKRRDDRAQYGDPLAAAMMKQIKNTLDPGGIMNPGKIFHLNN